MKKITKKAYGKNIKITDARDNFDLAINNAYGNTEQDTTNGKNLLNYSGLTTQTIGGITYTPVYDDKGLLQYVNANGEATVISSYDVKRYISANGQCILNGCPSGGSETTYRMDCYYSGTSNNDIGEGVTFEAIEGQLLTTRIVIWKGVKVSNLKFYPMIRLASITDDTYEPFTNGASPNPEYPQEIKSVVLSEIRTCRKNLAKIDETNFTVSDNYITNKGVNSGSYLMKSLSLKANTTHYINLLLLSKPTVSTTFSGRINGVEQGGVSFIRFDEFSLNTVYTKKYTPTQDETLDYRMWGNANSDIFNFQFWISTDEADKTYEPYTESVATLSNPITLNGLNGVQDYADLKRGVLVQKFKEVVFNGSEEWSNMVTGTSNIYRKTPTNIFAKSVNSYSTANILCDEYRPLTANSTYQCMQGISVEANGRIGIYDENYNSLSEWKAHLEENPIIVVYELAEPIETPLPEADVEALKSLKTYDGVTHILTDSEVEPTLEVEYALLEAKDNWNYTDYILHTDYNRIVGNINYLKAYLDSLFIGLTNISTMEEKTAKSLIYAREINAIETALEQLNLETYKFDIGETKEYLPNTRTLNFEDLNRIESAIFMLAKQMTSHKENITRLAFTLGNQKGIRV